MKGKTRKKRRVIPGFGLSFGITLAMLGFIVVIPLCTLVIFSAKLSFSDFLATVTRPRVLSSYRVSLETALIAALIGGFTMSFARGLGEYGSVVFIAGNTPYETEITPLMIMSELQEYDYASATSIALVMLIIAFLILFINAVLQSRSSKIVSGIS